MGEICASGSVGGEGGNLLAYPAPLTDLNNRWPVTAQPTDLLYFVQRTNMRRPQHAFDLHYVLESFIGLRKRLLKSASR